MSSINKVSEISINHQKIDEFKNNSDVFLQVFTQALSGKDNAQGIDLSADNIDEIITNSQKILFSGLGLAVPESGKFASLDGAQFDESVSRMQNALITSLKSSMQATGNNLDSENRVQLSFVDNSNKATGADNSDKSTNNNESGPIDSVTQFAFGEDGAGTEELFDTVNVLNHIPIVSNLYQGVTGTKEPSPASKVLGASLFAGPVGAGLAAAEVGIDYFADIKLSQMLPWSGVTQDVANKAKETYGSVANKIVGE